MAKVWLRVNIKSWELEFPWKKNISTAYSIISEGNLIFLVTGSIQTLSVYSSTWKTDFVRELKFHKCVTYWLNKIGTNYDSRATEVITCEKWWKIILNLVNQHMYLTSKNMYLRSHGSRCELGFSRLKIGCCRHPAGWVGDLGFQIDNIDASIRSLRGRTGSHQYF